MPVSRRTLLKGGLAAGALVVASPLGALAEPLGPTTDAGATRASRLVPGQLLIHADLHNHSLQSDGAGDPALAFERMRTNGIDAAALTDHSSVSKGLAMSPCLGQQGCQGLFGVNDASWTRTLELANAANRDADFTAIRGFEWSSPTLGHFNVWFSQNYTDPLHTGAVASGANASDFVHEGIPGAGPVASSAINELLAAFPLANQATMAGFYEFLKRTTALDGGADAIGGFNHPGRETGRFGSFTLDPALLARVVSIEVFNRGEDYLFEGTDAGRQSPINEALNAGWRTGLLGVTDEHGTNWGSIPTTPRGEKGRGGLWVTELTRAGVRRALEQRRFFATRVRGLRLDATADGVPMGGMLPLPSPRTVQLALDLDRGPGWVGRPLRVQVLTSGPSLPRIAADVPVVVPGDGADVLRLSVPVTPADRWLVLRVSDLDTTFAAEDSRAAGTDYAGRGGAVAYSSPFFLNAQQAPAVIPEGPAAVALPVAAAALAGAAVLAAQHRAAHAHDVQHAPAD